MAVANVKKFELYVYQAAVDRVLSLLQERGICEISVYEPENPADEISSAVKEDSALAGALSDVSYLTRYLAPYYKDPVGGFARMLGERDDVSVARLASLAEQTDIAALAADVRKRERRLTELKSEMQQTESLQQILSGLTAFTAPLSMITEGSSLVAGFLGTGRPENLLEWKEAVQEAFGEDCECSVFIPEKGDNAPAWGSVFALRSLSDRLAELCLKHSVTKIDLPSSLTDTVEKERAELSEKAIALKQEEEYYAGWLKSFADKNMDTVRQLGDYFAIMKIRTDAASKSEHTAQVTLLKGWVPAGKIEELKETVKPFASDIELRVSDPDEGDNPPIVLENPEYARPFEMLTMLYGAPVYDSVDPSLPMMPFFLLFFGMCYADAGYGLIITLIAMHFLNKYRRMPDSIKQALIMIKYCGYATIAFGAVTGGWMGNMIATFPFLHFLAPVADAVTLLEPMKNPMLLLGISLVLGIIHIYYGLFLAAWDNLRHGDKLAACADQGGWLLLLTGLLVFGAGAFAAPALAVPGKIISLLGALILIATQGREKEGIISKFISGVLSLYNVTSYLGDVLSYSRLLALGLVGGAVAMIINLMSSLCGGVAYVGWVIGAVIFIGGHIFSMVINILGAFVHPLRLQYVEFFGKFYRSGGTAFNPFCYKADYVNISGENEK